MQFQEFHLDSLLYFSLLFCYSTVFVSNSPPFAVPGQPAGKTLQGFSEDIGNGVGTSWCRARPKHAFEFWRILVIHFELAIPAVFSGCKYRREKSKRSMCFHGLRCCSWGWWWLLAIGTFIFSSVSPLLAHHRFWFKDKIRIQVSIRWVYFKYDYVDWSFKFPNVSAICL